MFDMEHFPLRQEVVFCESSTSMQPAYLTPDSLVIDLGGTSSCKASSSAKSEKIGRRAPLAPVPVAEIEGMLAKTNLDPSQQVALAHALTHRLAIIQDSRVPDPIPLGTYLLHGPVLTFYISVRIRINIYKG